jgi:hypothetical protein
MVVSEGSDCTDEDLSTVVRESIVESGTDGEVEPGRPLKASIRAYLLPGPGIAFLKVNMSLATKFVLSESRSVGNAMSSLRKRM